MSYTETTLRGNILTRETAENHLADFTESDILFLKDEPAGLKLYKHTIVYDYNFNSYTFICARAEPFTALNQVINYIFNPNNVIIYYDVSKTFATSSNGRDFVSYTKLQNLIDGQTPTVKVTQTTQVVADQVVEL